MPGLLHRQQRDRLDQQKHAHDDAEDTHRLGGNSEEDQGEKQVGQSDAGVAEGEEARAAGVEARRRHELADQLDDPPDEGDEGKEDGDPSDYSDGPKVVRGYLNETVLLGQITVLLLIILCSSHFHRGALQRSSYRWVVWPEIRRALNSVGKQSGVLIGGPVVVL